MERKVNINSRPTSALIVVRFRLPALELGGEDFSESGKNIDDGFSIHRDINVVDEY